MRRTIALAALAVLAGCGSPSTLSEDDQTFCSEQEDELAYAREAVDDIVNGDRHWSSDGEAFAVNEVAITPGTNYLSAYDAQDDELRRVVKKTLDALFWVRLDLPDNAFDNDAQHSRDAAKQLDALQAFCDENG